VRVLAVLAALLALPAATAQAVTEPPQLLAGANSKWISGDLLSQTGLNCSTAILGEPYTEIMVSGIASYGGLQSVPKVGQQYWTGFLVSIPGNPCGSGSSSVVTTLVLPPHTQTAIDATHPIKCFGLPRNATSTTPWQDVTNQSWSFLGSSGPYCPTQPSVSPYHQGGLQFGFRPLANGQLFWIFVPVKSDAQLVGAGTSPADGFRWLTDATGVYANPGLSTVWANVLPNAGANPFVYFAQEPAAIPFWKEDALNDPGNGNITTKSRVEWLANLYSAGKAGNFCWQLHKVTPPDPGLKIDSCSPPWPGWDPTITNAGDLWQVFGSGEAKGPNGGYSPLYYDDDPPGTSFFVRWRFIPTDGSAPVFKDAPFTTLTGPDQDGDSVPNNGADACPGVKGTLPNGCLPAVQADPDKDGVYGAADLCPNQDGQGAANGCLGGIVPDIPKPPDPPKPTPLVATLLTKSGTVFKKASLTKGAPVKFECTVDSAASGVLSITKKVATKLRIKTKKKQKTVGIASGKGQCKAVGGGSLKLKLLRAYATKVKKAKKPFPASLAVKLTAAGQTPVTVKRPVKVR
jgi:hypothetical protein